MRKTKYVKIIIGGLALVMCGYIAATLKERNKSNKELLRAIKKGDGFKAYYKVLNAWMKLKRSGKSLESYFQENGYHNIAVYGMGEVGTRLIEELENSNINIKYGIDKYNMDIISPLTVFSPDDQLEDVDAVIVTAVYDFEVIKEDMMKKLSCPVISIEDVVYSL